MAQSQLKSLIIQDIPESYDNFDVILGDEIFINNFKLMKFLKHGFKLLSKKPSSLFNKEKRNIKFHFDMWHGSYYLEKAIELLDEKDKNDFRKFVNTKVSFNPLKNF